MAQGTQQQDIHLNLMGKETVEHIVSQVLHHVFPFNHRSFMIYGIPEDVIYPIINALLENSAVQSATRVATERKVAILLTLKR